MQSRQKGKVRDKLETNFNPKYPTSKGTIRFIWGGGPGAEISDPQSPEDTDVTKVEGAYAEIYPRKEILTLHGPTFTLGSPLPACKKLRSALRSPASGGGLAGALPVRGRAKMAGGSMQPAKGRWRDDSSLSSKWSVNLLSWNLCWKW